MQSPPFAPASSSDSLDTPVLGCTCATWRRTASWPAIFAGLAAALALQFLFMMLGAGLGFALYSPLTNEHPIAELGAGAVIIQGISAVLSLWFGGWVAGRFTPRGARTTAWLHGFCVWCVATVAGVLFVSVGAGWALGDLSKLVGGGLSLAGQPAAAVAGGVTDLAKDALKQSGDTLASFTDEAMGNRPPDAAGGNAVRAKREVGLALARFFNPAQEAGQADHRAALVKALTDQAGLSPADAERTVTEWTASYDRLKADLLAAKNAAEAKARAAAEKAANALAVLSLGAFAGFLFGAVAASCGGHQGAKCAGRCEARADTLTG